MARVNCNIGFMKRKISILRPATRVDVSLVRDRVLTNYVEIATNVRCWIEPAQSQVQNSPQLGNILVGQDVGFFPQLTSITQNDIIKEAANRFNGNQIVYWKVLGLFDYSFDGFLIRVDLDRQNYSRAQ
jgi:hypothetical protein